MMDVSKPVTEQVVVIQKIISGIKAQVYLEIGVKEGVTFFNQNCEQMVAVDPCIIYNFAFNKVVHRELHNIKFKKDPHIRVYEMTSDDFFKNNNERFDLVFVDGHHTAEQSYRDIINSMKWLTGKGLVLVHDVDPINERCANPTSEWVNEWSGDVWRTIVRLRHNRPDLKMFTLPIPFGLTVIKPTHNATIVPKNDTWQEISYNGFQGIKNDILNYKTMDYLEDFLNAHIAG